MVLEDVCGDHCSCTPKNARVGATERRGVQGGEGGKENAHGTGLSTHR